MDGNFGMPGMGGMGAMQGGINGIGNNMFPMPGMFINPNPGINFMMPGMNIGGNWMSIYNNNNIPQVNNNINNSFMGVQQDNKINVVFKTTKGVKTNVLNFY